MSTGTVQIVVAIIAAAGVILGAILAGRAGSRRQLNEIHVLVNSRLTEALGEIDTLKAMLSDHGVDPEREG